MNEQANNSASRSRLKERIVNVTMEAFMKHGIKSITMDDIAASLGISKRTLYEVFPGKESLLEVCIRRGHEEFDDFVRGVLSTTSNVMEVVLRIFQWNIRKFHATNKRFFEDIKKYPKACQLMIGRRNRDSEEVVRFLEEG
ncbi:TetR/AcrR family transcriptional regulator, partial [Mesomycoplasma ovipneumoniae]|uniref:TetR/AcrR family transcriptional regulator n=1 Tax=Mesomycoplasma ovipneumoniae TaxID=29562 RepID=UPI003080A45E